MVKVISKDSSRNKGYKVKILKKNEQNTSLDAYIYNEEIKRIYILPLHVQQGIESTINYSPNINNIKGLTSVVEFGERPIYRIPIRKGTQGCLGLISWEGNF